MVERQGRAIRRPLLGYLRLLVGVSLLYLLFHLVPLRQVLAQIGSARIAPLLGVLVLSFCAMVVSALKLWLLLRTAQPQVPYMAVLKAYYIGAFFNNFLPTGIGGDIVKTHRLHVEGAELKHAAASVIVERGMGLLVVLGAALAVSLGWDSFLRQLGLGPVRWALAAFSGGCFLALGLLYAVWRGGMNDWMKAHRERRLVGKAYGVIESFYLFRNNPQLMAAALGLSAVFYAIAAANFVVAGRALGASLSLAGAAGTVPLVHLPELLPISVGGLGVREGALTYCLSRLGPTAAQAAGVALVLRALNWVHSAAGGFVYAVAGRPRGDERLPPAASSGSTARRRAFRFAVLVLIVLALSTDDRVDGQNELSRMVAVESLAIRGEWNVDGSPIAQVLVGREGRQFRYLIDMVHNRRDGHFYSSKPPVLTLLLAAVPAAARALGARFTLTNPRGGASVFLLTFLAIGLPTAWAFYAYRRRAADLLKGPAGADVVTLLALGGTLFVSYSVAVNHHTPTAAAILGAFFLLGMAEGSPDVSGRRAFAAGFLMALASVIDIGHGFIFSIAFGLYVLICLRSWRTVVYFGLGALPPLAVHCAVQCSLWGSLLPVQMLSGTKDYAFSYWGSKLGPDTWQIPRSRYWLLTLFSVRGLFVLSPILLFGVAGLLADLRDGARAFRHRQDGSWLSRPPQEALRGCAALAVLLGIVFLVWYYSFQAPTNFAGAAFGFRYYIGFAPLLAWYAARAFGRWAKSAPFRIAFYSAGAWSVCYAVLGMRYTWQLMEDIPHGAVRMLLPLRGF